METNKTENGHDESIEQVLGAEMMTGDYPGGDFPGGVEFPGKQKTLKAQETIDISVKRMELVTTEFEVQGVTSLITVPMSKKAIEGIEEAVKRKGKKKTAAGPIAPETEEVETETDDLMFKRSVYVISEGPPVVYGFPSIGFKKTLVNAARWIPSIPRGYIDAILEVDEGELVPITGVTPRLRVDTGRTAPMQGRTRTFVVKRAEFPAGWKAKFKVTWDKTALGPMQLANLIDRAGWYSGIGAWRPSALGGGNHGRFRLL